MPLGGNSLESRADCSCISDIPFVQTPFEGKLGLAFVGGNGGTIVVAPKGPCQMPKEGEKIS